VNAAVVLQARDLVLHMQLAALQFDDFQVVARKMHLRLEDFLLECLMPSLKFRKMRLDGHARFLLMSWAAGEKPAETQFLHESGPVSTVEPLCIAAIPA
jgi:hypothetical protein